MSWNGNTRSRIVAGVIVLLCAGCGKLAIDTYSHISAAETEQERRDKRDVEMLRRLERIETLLLAR